MITREVTVHEGEYLGPIDWSYDFGQHGWDRGGSMNPEHLKTTVEYLRAMEREGRWEATTDGGWPRVGWHNVIRIGMYDGWPYWKPVPSIQMAGPLGCEWHSFMSISEIRRLP